MKQVIIGEDGLPLKINQDGSLKTSQNEAILQEQLTNTNAVTGTLTFAENINLIEIFNTDTVNDGVFNVNGINITVPKNTPFQASVGGTPRKTVTVTGATTYIVSRYKYV